MPLAERLQSLFVALAALTGLATGLLLPIGPTAAHAVLPALILMLTAVFLQMNFARLGEARHATRLVTTSLILNFAVTPALAWTLGAGLLTTHPDLRIGLLLLLVTPCTDWYLVFTALAHGHTGLATALLPVNLLLQLALLPGYVLLLGGNAAMVDATTLTESVLLVLALPLTTALGLRWIATRLKGAHWRHRFLTTPASRLVLPLLYAAVFAMFAGQARTVVTHAPDLIALLPPLAIFFTALPATATATARILRLPPDQRVTLVMTTTARNSPTALAIAVAAFPDRPLIAVALVIGPLLEIPVLTLLTQLVRIRPPHTTSSPR
ncbi:bile acid:sodium symporter [Thermobifida fusca]|jgi:ACR3 family arsenite transporter|uniref:Arsenite efflux pump n=2 Tax=Thermobifida fusca TaxID=2021 RepID=A0A9P2TAU6_THEFU|nr:MULTISPECIES: bile acid:sodium symporter [Thermobifida]AAZ55605.1 arsenite efflux pump [Thermobifida fusca YX]EOR71348.1 arsenite efflux pump [Thermobifida fusca TM51]MBO2531155.1 arsenic resistance protein [Thermobifida sp.]PPS91109.1 arsenite transporter [Thermobifida fusca]QOS58158.1 arsenic resistance protein [Thermobifida fusca]